MMYRIVEFPAELPWQDELVCQSVCRQRSKSATQASLRTATRGHQLETGHLAAMSPLEVVKP